MGYKEIQTDEGIKETVHDDLSKNQEFFLLFISFCVYAVAKIVDTLLDHSIIHLTRFEHNLTLDDHDTSCVYKTVILQFMNLGLLIVTVHYILNKSHRYFIWGVGGLLTDVWFIIVFNSILIPLLYVVDIPHLIKKCRRKLAMRPERLKKYNQRELNEIFQEEKIDPISCYTDIYQIYLTSLFFVPAFPANTIINVVSLFIMYWAKKIYLLKRYRRPRILSGKIALRTLVFMKAGAFTQASGQAYFDLILRNEIHIVSIIQMIVTFILIWVPIEDVFINWYVY